MEREQGDQNSKPCQQQREDPLLRAGRDAAGVGCQFSESDQIKRAFIDRQTAVQTDQTDQQHETAYRQIDRDLPSGGHPVFPVPPDTDQQKGRDQGQLMKGVKEKEIERDERSDGTSRDKEQAGVERVFTLLNLGSNPNRGQRDQRGEQHHHQAQSVQPDQELQIQRGDDVEERMVERGAVSDALQQGDQKV